jgi:hypothetical protein
VFAHTEPEGYGLDHLVSAMLDGASFSGGAKVLKNDLRCRGVGRLSSAPPTCIDTPAAPVVRVGERRGSTGGAIAGKLPAGSDATPSGPRAGDCLAGVAL